MFFFSVDARCPALCHISLSPVKFPPSQLLLATNNLLATKNPPQRMTASGTGPLGTVSGSLKAEWLDSLTGYNEHSTRPLSP